MTRQEWDANKGLLLYAVVGLSLGALAHLLGCV
jgi:hypothetical protein